MKAIFRYKLRWIPVFSALFLVFGLSFGQGTIKVKKDVVYLKNESVLVGEIEELFPDSVVKIRIEGGSFFVIEWKEISKIAKEEREVAAPENNLTPKDSLLSKPGKPKYRDKGPYRFIEKGYVPSFQSSWLVGNNGSFGNVSASFQSLHNIVIRHFLSPGILLGLDRYNAEISIFSPMINVRGDLLKNRRVSPYYLVKGGYGLMVRRDKTIYPVYEGGLVYGLEVGAHFFSRFRTSYYLGAGYQSQRTYREYELWDWLGPTGVWVTERRAFNRMTMTMGIAF